MNKRWRHTNVKHLIHHLHHAMWRSCNYRYRNFFRISFCSGVIAVYVCSRLVVVWVVFGVFVLKANFWCVWLLWGWRSRFIRKKNYHSRFTDFFNYTVIPTYLVYAFGLNGPLSWLLLLQSMLLYFLSSLVVQ